MGAGDVFPLTPDFVYEPGDRFRTLVSEFESGKEQRRALWSAGLAQFLVRKRFVSSADIAALRAFFKARKGAYDYFWFDDPSDDQATNEAIGMGTGAQTVFTLARYPVQAAAGAFTMRVNGTPVSAALSNDNVNLQAKVTFAVAPASGAAVAGDYKFYYVVRFTDDLLVRQLTSFNLHDVETKLQEVRL
ncbi:MAG: DUF2460 domain-containing protein [Candidatus Omnitrophica bacterium]|nr:DUF2460 domain-containing protein [Candidatus Omnitrophota bacterium]